MKKKEMQKKEERKDAYTTHSFHHGSVHAHIVTA